MKPSPDAHRVDQPGLHGRVMLLLGYGGQGIADRLGGRHSRPSRPAARGHGARLPVCEPADETIAIALAHESRWPAAGRGVDTGRAALEAAALQAADFGDRRFDKVFASTSLPFWQRPEASRSFGVREHLADGPYLLGRRHSAPERPRDLARRGRLPWLRGGAIHRLTRGLGGGLRGRRVAQRGLLRIGVRAPVRGMHDAATRGSSFATARRFASRRGGRAVAWRERQRSYRNALEPWFQT